MNKNEILKRVNEEGISFDQFNEEIDSFITVADETEMDDLQEKRFGFTKLNQRRTERIIKTFKIGDELKELLLSVYEQQTWLVITEPWCGDSAQTLPNIFMMSELNNKIDLKIIYRDKNLDIIDQYLTNGNRAIPKLIVFDKNGEELFKWGPRPAEARDLIMQWKSEGDTQEQFNEKLHLWYGRSRGKELEKEFIDLLKTIPHPHAPLQE